MVMVQSLPKVEIAKAIPEKPLLFRFDGGEGALMPLKSPNAQNIIAR